MIVSMTFLFAKGFIYRSPHGCSPYVRPCAGGPMGSITTDCKGRKISPSSQRRYAHLFLL